MEQSRASDTGLWPRIESQLTGLVMFYVDMWEPGPGHTQVTRAPGDESWGADGRDPGNSDKALVIHRNVPRNGRHVFLCLA